MSLLDALLLDPAPFNVWIAYRTDGLKSSGTASDPYDGSTATKLDGLLSTLPAGTRVHLGPCPRDGSGTVIPFQTLGYTTAGTSGWSATARTKIIGAGMDVTVLKVINTSGGHIYAVGHALDEDHKADFFEISDLTIDCNKSTTGAFRAYGAVRLMGEHVRIRRVKAIHWGSEAGSSPCFVFSIITSAPDGGVPEVADAGIEECVADTPASNAGPVFILHTGGVDGQSFTHEGHGKSPCIRNCFVDGGVSTPNPAAPYIRAISMSWCRGGVVEGNHIYNCDIGGPYQDTRSIRDLIVRNNFFKNTAQGIILKPGALGSSLVTSAANLSTSNGVATISGGGLNTTSLDVGDRVSITTPSPPTFTGVYQIASVQYGASPQFTFLTSGNGPANVTIVQKIPGVSRAIIEGNVIELSPDVSGVSAVSIEDNNEAGSLVEPPDYVHGDIYIRNNKIRYVDGAVPDDAGATLIQVKGAKNLIVQNNLLDTISTSPLEAVRCGSASYFDNRTVAGELATPPGAEANDYKERLEIPADDALVLACFHHS